MSASRAQRAASRKGANPCRTTRLPPAPSRQTVASLSLSSSTMRMSAAVVLVMIDLCSSSSSNSSSGADIPPGGIIPSPPNSPPSGTEAAAAASATIIPRMLSELLQSPQQTAPEAASSNARSSDSSGATILSSNSPNSQPGWRGPDDPRGRRRLLQPQQEQQQRDDDDDSVLPHRGGNLAAVSSPPSSGTTEVIAVAGSQPQTPDHPVVGEVKEGGVDAATDGMVGARAAAAACPPVAARSTTPRLMPIPSPTSAATNCRLEPPPRQAQQPEWQFQNLALRRRSIAAAAAALAARPRQLTTTTLMTGPDALGGCGPGGRPQPEQLQLLRDLPPMDRVQALFLSQPQSQSSSASSNVLHQQRQQQPRRYQQPAVAHTMRLGQNPLMPAAEAPAGPMQQQHRLQSIRTSSRQLPLYGPEIATFQPQTDNGVLTKRRQLHTFFLDGIRDTGRAKVLLGQLLEANCMELVLASNSTLSVAMEDYCDSRLVVDPLAAAAGPAFGGAAFVSDIFLIKPIELIETVATPLEYM